MAITLQLKPEVEASLASQAEARGLPIDAYIEEVLENREVTSPSKSRTPAEIKARLVQIVQEFDKLPTMDRRSADEIIGYDQWGLPTR